LLHVTKDDNVVLPTFGLFWNQSAPCRPLSNFEKLAQQTCPGVVHKAQAPLLECLDWSCIACLLGLTFPVMLQQCSHQAAVL